MNKQYRYLQGDMRASQDEHKLSGYFAVFGPAYEMMPGVKERIASSAFDDTLKNDNGDIRCLWNHDDNIVLGRTGSGTLSLRADEHGLFGVVTINPNDTDAMNALARVQRGDVSQCSFGFVIEDEEVFEHNNELEFLIKRVKLYEVSPVTFPAYKETSIKARKHEIENARARVFSAWQERMKGNHTWL